MLGRFIVCGFDVLSAERPRNDGSPSSTEVLEGLVGVTDGARTRDTQDHNLVLYQLNYSHHCCDAVLTRTLRSAVNTRTDGGQFPNHVVNC